MYVLTYVDDLLIIQEDNELTQIGQVLNEEFETKDLGGITY
jgi:hypothetical protein